MKVGVNLCWLVPGVVGGSEQAMVRTLNALVDNLPADLQVALFALDGFAATYPGLCARFETHTMPGSSHLSRPGLASKGLRVAGEHTWLPWALRRAGVDVVHDAGGTTPGSVRCPRVVTIHDIQPLDIPANFNPVKVAYLRWAIPAAVRKAAAVAVPSQFVSDRIQAVLGVDANQIHVVPWPAPDPEPQIHSGRRSRAQDAPNDYQNGVGDVDGAEVADGDRLVTEGRPFILQNVNTYPHKDHATTIRAFARIADRHPDLTLVLAGGEGPAEDAVRAQIRDSGFSGRITRTGRLSDAAIARLISDARAVVVPSRYEGFGIPALEAMAAGTPVVVADAGSLPEVVGDAGVVIPPGDDAQLAIELHQLLDDDALVQSLADRGRARAATFTPDRTADALISVYRSAAAGL